MPTSTGLSTIFTFWVRSSAIFPLAPIVASAAKMWKPSLASPAPSRFTTTWNSISIEPSSNWTDWIEAASRLHDLASQCLNRIAQPDRFHQLPLCSQHALSLNFSVRPPLVAYQSDHAAKGSSGSIHFERSRVAASRSSSLIIRQSGGDCLHLLFSWCQDAQSCRPLKRKRPD